MLNIKGIKAKYKETPNDSTLARELELVVNLKFIPEKQLCGQSIILEDESGTLEAVAKANIFDQLKDRLGQLIKFSGRLDKTEFGNIAYLIEEIIE